MKPSFILTPRIQKLTQPLGGVAVCVIEKDSASHRPIIDRKGKRGGRRKGGASSGSGKSNDYGMRGLRGQYNVIGGIRWTCLREL